MSYRFFSLKFLTISLCLVGLFNILSLRTADAAGSVAMQAASLMKLAPQAYNMGMRNGNADKWNQYFESKSRRSLTISGSLKLSRRSGQPSESPCKTLSELWNTSGLRLTNPRVIRLRLTEWLFLNLG